MARTSVILAVRNMDTTIHAAIASVLVQSSKDIKIIVVDNQSTDSTIRVVERLMEKDSRITLQTCALPGPFVARNQAMQNLDCDYVAVMDGDDLCLPTRLSEQVQALDENPRLSAVGSRIIQFGDSARIPAMAVSAQECRNLISLFNPCCHPSLMIRRTALDKVGLYDPTFEIGGDYDLVRRLTYCGDVENLARPLLLYRVHNQQITVQKKHEQRLTAYRVLQKHITYLHNGKPASDSMIIAHMTAMALRARWDLKRQAYRSLRATASIIAHKYNLKAA
jgi:glycosyltransferase involved in cell wall biosynthesis